MALDNEGFPDITKIAEKLNQRLGEAIALKTTTMTSLIAGRQPLLPIRLSMSTFELPVVDASRREAYLKPYLDTFGEKLLGDTLDWVPPGWKSPSMMRLWPLNNGGNGDCLFQAVSVALWGKKDGLEVLQNLVAEVFEHDEELLQNVWKEAFNGEEDQDDIQNKWERLKKFSLKTGSPPFYIFVLANILRRPIIEISDQYGRRGDLTYIESQELYSSIYLPTLLEPDKCCPTPLVIGLTSVVDESGERVGHSIALVGVHRHLSHVRLFDKDGVPFSIDYGERESWVKDVKAYMSIELFQATNDKTYYLAKVGESKMVAPRARDIAVNLKRKHENDRTDDDNSRRKMKRVESHPVSSIDDGGGRGNKTSEGQPPTPPPVSSGDDGGGPGSEGREVRPPTPPPVSSVDGRRAVRAATERRSWKRRRRVTVTCLVAATFIATRFVVKG